MKRSILAIFLFFISRALYSQTGSGAQIDFVSDTQQPMWIEKFRLRANQNPRATSMIFSRILQDKPLAVFITGDVVAIGSQNRRWKKVDHFIDSCLREGIGVHALLGNHDLMWGRRNGEKNFTRRFPDSRDTGYVSIVDSMAVVMLNSNFSKLTAAETGKELRWYASVLEILDIDPGIRSIIVSCHHSPYSNSLTVGSSRQTQQYFVPAFVHTKKCRLFISGHAHDFEHFRFFEKDFMVIGGGGGLHQPLDTSAQRLPDLAPDNKLPFHYLSVRREGDKLIVTSHFVKADFSGFENGHKFEIIN